MLPDQNNKQSVSDNVCTAQLANQDTTATNGTYKRYTKEQELFLQLLQLQLLPRNWGSLLHINIRNVALF